MLNETIQYRKGYKYQLARAYRVSIGIFPETSIRGPYISLTKTGKLTITKGYAWDGPSGPTIDTKNFMRGSLVHDVLYQLMRHDLLSQNRKDEIDCLLFNMCLEDGMSRIRAWWVYKGLQIGGRAATLASGQKRIHRAP